MTQRELFNAVKGYNEKQNILLRATWEQTRWLGAVIANANSTKRIQPRDLMKLPWEQEDADRSDELELLKERRKWLTQ